MTELSVETRNLRGGVRKCVISTHGHHISCRSISLEIQKDDTQTEKCHICLHEKLMSSISPCEAFGLDVKGVAAMVRACGIE